MAESYEKAGVNLEAGYEVVRRIKKHVASTSRLGVMGNIGAFGGMFDLSALFRSRIVLIQQVLNLAGQCRICKHGKRLPR